MRTARQSTRSARSVSTSIKFRRSNRPRIEELEVRNLFSVTPGDTWASNLPPNFNGYSPAELSQAYGLNQLTIAKPGQGETIAIVDAFESPNIQADLTTFDSNYGLPAINLTVINDGATKQDRTGGWELETAADVEYAHAIAPYANIVLVEAANDSVNAAGVPTALLHAVTVAASQPGVTVVSMSWSVTEFSTETQFDSTFATPGVTYLAASGDNGTPPIWPAVSPNVVAVGGTTLQTTSTTGVYTEIGWGSGSRSPSRGGSGGGISQFEPEPAYQVDTDSHYVTSVTAAQNPQAMRTSPDVAYDGDPNTGAAVYDQSNGGWMVVGGTSIGTPQWAGLVALADQVRAGAGQPALSSTQTLTALYQEQGDFYDVTSGNNGYAAGTGYDLVTGLGSPQANLLVPALAQLASVPGVTTSDPTRTTPPTTPPNQPPGSATFTVTGTPIQAAAGQSFSGEVGTISNAPAGSTPTSFTATIRWGDGTTSPGTISVDPNGGFDVSGSHTYSIDAFGDQGWGGGWDWGRHHFGWGGSPFGSSNETFRVTIVVSSTASPGVAIGYTSATVASSGATPLSPNQQYITQLYNNLLGRAPDPSGLAFWNGVLNQGASLASVVLQIEQSQEYLANEVQTIYQTLLQRPADASGLATFTAALANGASVEQIQATIAGSQEYFMTRGGGTAAGYLNALYTDALNRPADPGGETAFEAALANGVSRTAIAEAIFSSQEYRQDLVANDYLTLLNRPADGGGLATFATALGQGATDQQVIAALVSSEEYLEDMGLTDQ